MSSLQSPLMGLPSINMPSENNRNYFYQHPHGRQNLSSTSPFGQNHGNTRDHIDPTHIQSPTYLQNEGFAPFAGHDAFGPQDVVLDSTNGDVGLPRPRAPDINTDPLQRFYNSKDESWAPPNVGSVARWQTSKSKYSVPRDHGPTFSAYREGPLSNVDSQLTGNHRDSGYHTGTVNDPNSHYSGSIHGDENTSLVNGMGNTRLGSDYNPGPNVGRNGQFSEYYEPTPYESPQMNICSIQSCKNYNKPMNPSDYKKHMQRHEKPFKCDIQGCTRLLGFTTKNDLERHQKSIHKKMPTNASDRSFMCVGKNCNKRNKLWPRLDNFKSHCNRMHSKEDVDSLIKRSEAEAARNRTEHEKSPRGQRSPSSEAIPQYEADLLMGLSSTTHHNEQRPDFHTKKNTMQYHEPKIQQYPQTSDTKERISRPVEYPYTPTNQYGPERLSVPDLSTHSVGMARAHSHHGQAPTRQRSASQGSQNSVQHISSHPRRASENTCRTAQENEALAVRLEESRRPSSQFTTSASSDELETQTKIQELTRAITNDLTRTTNMPSLNENVIHSIVQQHLQSTISSLKQGHSLTHSHSNSTGHKRSASDAALPADPSSRPSKKVACPTCQKLLPRQCDLKKHMKRHSRPWGCTNEGCNKSFGSKNDWKRHENSQHYQLETWRCHEASSTSRIRTCARIFFRRDPFATHLRRDHGVVDEEKIRTECKARRIGRNWQSGFWCGFCKAIVRLQKRGLEAWDERFNHIDNEHFKKGEAIDEWYPMDKDVPKGRLWEEKKRRARDGGAGRGGGLLNGAERGGAGAGGSATGGGGGGAGDDDQLSDDSSEFTDVLNNQLPSPPPPPPPPPPPGPPGDLADGNAGEGSSRGQRLGLGGELDHGRGSAMAQSSEQASRLKKQKGSSSKRSDMQWYCHQCHHGPLNDTIDTHCVSCGTRTTQYV